METLPILIGALLALILFDAVAAAFGVDSRDGFSDDRPFRHAVTPEAAPVHGPETPRAGQR